MPSITTIVPPNLKPRIGKTPDTELGNRNSNASSSLNSYSDFGNISCLSSLGLFPRKWKPILPVSARANRKKAKAFLLWWKANRQWLMTQIRVHQPLVGCWSWTCEQLIQWLVHISNATHVKVQQNSRSALNKSHLSPLAFLSHLKPNNISRTPRYSAGLLLGLPLHTHTHAHLNSCLTDTAFCLLYKAVQYVNTTLHHRRAAPYLVI